MRSIYSVVIAVAVWLSGVGQWAAAVFVDGVSFEANGENCGGPLGCEIVAGFLRASGSVTVSPGAVADVTLFLGSSCVWDGGIGSITALDGSSFTVTSGALDVGVQGGASGSISGATVSLSVQGNGTLTASGAELHYGVFVDGDGHATISGSSPSGDGTFVGIVNRGNGTLNLSNGIHFNNLQLSGTSHSTISNISFEDDFLLDGIDLYGSSTATFSSAHFEPDVRIRGLSTASFDGSTFEGSLSTTSTNPLKVVGGTIEGLLSDDGGPLEVSSTNLFGGLNVFNTTGSVASAQVIGSIVASKTTLVINGTTISQGLGSLFGSHVTMTGGSAQSLLVLGASGLASSAHTEDTSIGDVTAGSYTTVNLKGGTAGKIDASNSDLAANDFTINGTQVLNTVTARDFANISITNATLDKSLIVSNRSYASVSTTQIKQNASVSDFLSALDVTGGVIEGNVAVSNFGNFTLRAGGYVKGNVDVDQGFAFLGGIVDENVTASNAYVSLDSGKVHQAVSLTGGTLEMKGSSIAASINTHHTRVSLSSGSITYDVIIQMPPNGDEEEEGGGGSFMTSAVTIDGYLEVSGGPFTIQGGHMGSLRVWDGAKLTMTGGTVDGPSRFANCQPVDISAGTFVGEVRVDEHTTVDWRNVTAAGGVYVDGNSTFNLRSGILHGAIATESNFNIVGGQVTGTLLMDLVGTINMTGGTVEKLQCTNGGQFYLMNGNVSSEAVIGQGTIVMYGGKVKNLEVLGDGQIFGGEVEFVKSVGDSGNIRLMSAAMVGRIQSTFGSTIIVDGATITGKIEATEYSTVKLHSGNLGGEVRSEGTSFLEIGVNGGAGPTIAGDLVSRGFTTHLYNGKINGEVSIEQNSVFFMHKGELAHSLSALNTAHVHVTGGKIDAAAIAQNSALMFLDDVEIAGDLFATNSGVVTMTSGSVGGDVTALGTSTIILNGQSLNLGKLVAENTATLIVDGGASVANVTANIAGKFLLKDGDVDGTVSLNGDSRAQLGPKGTISGAVTAQDKAFVSIAGTKLNDGLMLTNEAGAYMASGEINSLQAFNDSTFVSQGGKITGFLSGHDNAKIVVGVGTVVVVGGSGAASGAELSGVFGIVANDNSTITVLGTSMSATLVDPNYQNGYSLYQITGVSLDGTTMTNTPLYLQNGTGASFALKAPGDFNNDEVVDSRDYIVWRKSSGQSGAALAADGNFDGTVDDADLTVWRAHFGQSLHSSGSGSSLSSNVPEPASLTILLIGVAFSHRPSRPRRDNRSR